MNKPSFHILNRFFQFLTLLLGFLGSPVHFIHRYTEYHNVEKYLIEKIDTFLDCQLFVQRLVSVGAFDFQEALVYGLLIVVEPVAQVGEECPHSWASGLDITFEVDFLGIVDEGLREDLQHQCGNLVKHKDHLNYRPKPTQVTGIRNPNYQLLL